jgi:hypothetical protein
MTHSHDVLLAAAKAEIEDFHTFFDDWFQGSVENDEQILQARHGDRLADDFQLTYPGGVTMDRKGLIDGVRQAYGKSPGFRVQIRNVRLRPLVCDRHLLANYEEWQKNAVNSTPTNNARFSSAIFRIVSDDPIALEWFHLHETWLPREVMDADPFDY